MVQGLVLLLRQSGQTKQEIQQTSLPRTTQFCSHTTNFTFQNETNGQLTETDKGNKNRQQSASHHLCTHTRTHTHIQTSVHPPPENIKLKFPSSLNHITVRMLWFQFSGGVVWFACSLTVQRHISKVNQRYTVVHNYFS